MNGIKTVFLVALMAGICGAQNDFIALKNGQSAKTTVKDTAGCRVAIIRGGNAVQIEKSKIRYLRWGKDSISYETYACPEAPKKAVRFEDTPAGKILMFLDTCPELEQAVKPGEKVAYLPGAIAGVMEKGQDSSLMAAVIPVLSAKNSVFIATVDMVAGWIAGAPPFCKYAFITKKWGIEQNFEKTSGGGSVFGSMSAMATSGTRKEMFLVAEFVMLNLERREIVFHANAAAKHSVYSHDFSVLPENVKNKINDFRTGSAMADNMDGIAEKIERDLKRHLDIKDPVEF